MNARVCHAFTCGKLHPKNTKDKQFQWLSVSLEQVLLRPRGVLVETAVKEVFLGECVASNFWKVGMIM